MSSFISKKYFFITFFLLILAEIFSYLSWQNPLINTICFSLIILITLIISWRKLEYGLYILFAELFIGSFGYLFSLTINGFRVSLRMGIFVVVMATWLYRYLTQLTTQFNANKDCHSDRRSTSETLSNVVEESKNEIPRLRFAPLGMTKEKARITKKTMVTFAVVIIWAFIWGLIRGNGFSNVFLDFNNWLYFLIILPVFGVLKKYNHPGSSKLPEGLATPPLKGGDSKNVFFKNIISILSAAVIIIFLKTFFLFYLFTHGFADIGSEIYRLVRDTRIGEITLMGGGLYRIFIQSQIYSLLLFCILFFKGCHPERSEAESRDPVDKNKKENNQKLPITYYLLLITSLTTIILSLSRSFWLGLTVSLIIYFFYTLHIIHYTLLFFFKSFSKLLIVVIMSLCLIVATLYLPPKKDYDLSVLISKRGISSSEPASSSRISQLKPLLLAISQHPIIGSGFGTTVTYKSTDPRAIQESLNNSGLIKTYAFEWGYLDMMLKFGALGLFAYLYLIYLIMKRLLNFQFPISNFQTNCKFKIQNQKLVNHNSLFIIHYSLFFALLALLIVNIFSPYLNHPLGIGFLILMLIVANEGE